MFEFGACPGNLLQSTSSAMFHADPDSDTGVALLRRGTGSCTPHLTRRPASKQANGISGHVDEEERAVCSKKSGCWHSVYNVMQSLYFPG